MRKRILLASAFVLAAASALAATGDEIRAAISDSTVQGNMDDSGPYAEYYAPDGTIKGKDYSGQWSVEGDTMCFLYQDTPEECWNVEIKGDQVRWSKNGASQGTGTIVKGNVNGF
ncbi:MAG TPA: hypothetical protein VGQ35_07350 [Dongiaceae bacterium]|jgi:hypothetical protein|nr:hypothetical protein [Dongiaceae bacterium]